MSVAFTSHTWRLRSGLSVGDASWLRAALLVQQCSELFACRDIAPLGLARICNGGTAVMNVTRSITQVEPHYPLPQAEEEVLSTGVEEVQDVYLEPGGNIHEQVLSLYKEYRPNLYAYVRSQYLSPDEAEDVIQETFLRLANKLLLNVTIENARGWVVHVAHHLTVDVIRRRDRDAARISHVSDYEFESFKAQGTDPECALIEREQQRNVELALSRLTPQQRQCFQMRAEGFRYKDIGAAHGISEQRAQLVVKQVTVRLAAAISG